MLTAQLPPTDMTSPVLTALGISCQKVTFISDTVLTVFVYCVLLTVFCDMCMVTWSLTGTDRLQVEWSAPAELNGALQRYILSISAADGDSADNVVYNSSDLFTSYVIANLTAGSEYFVKVGVSARLLIRFNTILPRQSAI